MPPTMTPASCMRKRPVYFLEDFDSRCHDFNVIASGDVELDSARIVVLGPGFKVSVDE